MRVSTKGRYGVRAILDLGMHEDGEPVYLKEIARRQNLSYRYLERLFAGLRKAGIIRSVRGSQGGYQLARPASEILMLDVVEALEGPIRSVGCLDDPHICPITESCVPHDLWSRVNDAVQNVLAETTLAELVEEERKRISSIPAIQIRHSEGAEDHV